MTSITGTGSVTVLPANSKTGMAALGQSDFLKLMTVQMQQQDPFNPVDQKEMLAQMAQFSSLAGISEMGDTLKTIAKRLDAISFTQGAAATAASSAASTTSTTTTQGA